MILFFVGIIEMLIVTAWTNAVTSTKVFASGAITIVNILIWYYVLETIVNDITNWQLIALYALGCAVGTMAATALFRSRDKKREQAAEDKVTA